jgi:hypothetical protein
VIHEIDESLETIVTTDALEGTGIEVLFDAPTKDWAARRNTPTINLFLYDIREDAKRRHIGELQDRDEEGILRARGRPPRYFRLSYVVTAWTQRPEDEHRLLSALLSSFLRNRIVPLAVLTGSLAELKLPVLLEVGKPLPENRQVSEVWTAIDSDVKASLDVVVTAPMSTAPVPVTAPPASEGTVVRMFGEPGQESEAHARPQPAYDDEDDEPPGSDGAKRS